MFHTQTVGCGDETDGTTCETGLRQSGSLAPYSLRAASACTAQHRDQRGRSRLPSRAALVLYRTNCWASPSLWTTAESLKQEQHFINLRGSKILKLQSWSFWFNFINIKWVTHLDYYHLHIPLLLYLIFGSLHLRYHAKIWGEGFRKR